VAGNFGEVERDDDLANRHDGPGPDEHAAQRDEAKGEEREDTGRRRDIAERRGEGTEESEGSVQFLLVAKGPQVLGVTRSACDDADELAIGDDPSDSIVTVPLL